MRVLTPDQMRAADAAAIALDGDGALMREAGRRVAERVRAVANGGRRVVVFAGPGNNGGDGFAAAAELGREFERVVYAQPAERASPARAAAMQRASESGVTCRPLPPSESDARNALAGAIGIDALFGTGARLPLGEAYRPLARALDARAGTIVAVDIPSGIDALTGAVAGDAVRATETITLAAAKPGLFLDPARDRVGALWLGYIGIGDAVLAAQPQRFAALDDAAFRAMLPVRAGESDKRASGAPLVIAGSAQFPGAAVLCARGAARAGAGYVTVATAGNAANLLRAHLVEQVVVAILDGSVADAVDDLLDIAQRNGSVAVGPGLGLDERTGAIIVEFLRRNTLPAVVDASALFHLSKHLDVLRGKPAVLTPHAGEFARLSGKGTIASGERVTRLREFVERTGIVTLLKGRTTLIDNGTTMHLNATGNSALATAGTGDVLTGIVGTLLSQGLSSVDAACAGAYWHGLAGRLCARERPVGVLAGDLPDALAAALPPSHIANAKLQRIF